MGSGTLKLRETTLQSRPIMAVLLLALSAFAAYFNTFGVPFLLDCSTSIVNNPTIRSLSPVLTAPPELRGSTVDGRPFLNFTFALNYAVGGLSVWGYHAANLLIHFFAALTLYGLVRRTLLTLKQGSAARRSAGSIALATALLWVVHPLNTQAVTYIVQRAESLASLFYLLTLYAFARSADSETPAYWQAAAFLSCLFGVATKEILVTAPLAALLYDRAFLGGSFRKALKRRWLFHAFLWATLIALALLMISTGNRGNTAGFASGPTPWEYFQTQLWAIPHYLRLALYPSPLIFHYGGKVVTGASNILLPGTVLALLLAGTIYAHFRAPKVGFPAALFFLVLAPTSTFVPIMDPVFEHRMYLPLACVILLLVLLGASGWEKLKAARPRAPKTIPALIVAILTIALTISTRERNKVYRDAETLWKDVIAKVPDNVRALSGLGVAYFEQNKTALAIKSLEAALAIAPYDDFALNNIAIVYQAEGRTEEARAALTLSLSVNPDRAAKKVNLGMILYQSGRTEEALALFREAVDSAPGSAQARHALGYALYLTGRPEEALIQLNEAARLRPDMAEIANSRGLTLAELSRHGEAVESFREAVGRDPGNTSFLLNLGNALLAANRNGEAADAFAKVLALDGTSEEARRGLKAASETTSR